MKSGYYFIISLFLGVVLSTTVYAWTDPISAPPNGNVSAPLNVGAVDQVKNSGLGINSLAVFGNSILSGTSRYLNWGTIAGTTGYGIRDNAGNLEFKNNGGAWAAFSGSGAESDPQVGTLTNGSWCTTNGTAVNCATAAPVLTEADPQVGTLTNGRWCTTNGTAVNCTSVAPVTTAPVYRLAQCSVTVGPCTPTCPAGYTLVNSFLSGTQPASSGFTTYYYIGICLN